MSSFARSVSILKTGIRQIEPGYRTEDRSKLRLNSSLAASRRRVPASPIMQLADLHWPAVQKLSSDTPVVIPVAALEQHGHHLPLFTDSLLLGEVLRRAADRVKDKALFAPLLWLGNSDHHLDFPGTLSARPRVYLDVLNGLIDDFVRHGFRRIVFINGHGGNSVPGRQAVFEARQRYRERADLLLLFATYWDVGSVPAQVLKTLHQQHMRHACEWETSMILRLNPSLVGDFKAAQPVEPPDTFAPASRAWTTRDLTTTGHIGYPHLATPEKGEALFSAFADNLAAFLENVTAWDGKTF
jgi:creatinine amidohydrolase